MSDANIAALIGSLLIILQLIVARWLDYRYPKGWVSKKTLENSVKIDEEEESEEDDHE